MSAKINVSCLMSFYKNSCLAKVRKAIESVMAQSDCPDEFVFVRDGAVDCSVEKYLLNIKNIKTKHLYLKEQSGLGAALNYGLKNCTHQWVMRMDDDDICEADRLKIQKNVLRRQPFLDVLGGYISEFNPDHPGGNMIRIVPTNHDQIIKQFAKRNPINHVTVLMRKEIALMAGNYSNNIIGFEDYVLWKKMIKVGAKFGNVDRVLVRVSFSREQILSRRGFKYFRSEFAFQKSMLEQQHISHWVFLINLITRALPRLLPPFLLYYIYLKLLRR